MASFFRPSALNMAPLGHSSTTFDQLSWGLNFQMLGSPWDVCGNGSNVELLETVEWGRPRARRFRLSLLVPYRRHGAGDWEEGSTCDIVCRR